MSDTVDPDAILKRLPYCDADTIPNLCDALTAARAEKNDLLDKVYTLLMDERGPGTQDQAEAAESLCQAVEARATLTEGETQ